MYDNFLVEKYPFGLGFRTAAMRGPEREQQKERERETERERRRENERERLGVKERAGA